MEKYLKLNNIENLDKLKIPATILKQGGLVLFPTETVYGIGANGLDENATAKIFKAKNRKQDNPLILHISNYEMLEKIASNITPLEYSLMHEFWPGPFTIILQRKPIVPNIVTANLDTVAVRMPSNIIAKTLIEYTGLPIAAPSANISGKPSGTNIEDIYDELQEKVDYIIDGGVSEIGLESTVVRVIGNTPHILRPGKITANQIKKIAGKVVIDSHVLGNINTNTPVLSPGMKYRHYAPNSKCCLVYSKDNKKLVEKIKEIASRI